MSHPMVSMGKSRCSPGVMARSFSSGLAPCIWMLPGTRPVKVLSAKVAGAMSVLKLEGLDTPEEARTWRGRVLYLRRSDVKLAPGDYFIQDLIGLRVVDANDPSVEYGVVEDVSSTRSK